MGKRINPQGMLALVTGASSGIGLEFCRELASHGCNLILVSNQSDRLGECAMSIMREYGVDVSYLELDLTASDAARRLLAFCRDADLHPDILINNAGIFSFNEVVRTPVRKIECFIDLHVRAVATLCRVFGEEFAARGCGWILNMSSMSCWMPMPGLAMYSSTKAFIRVFSRSLHYELRPYGVRVMVACPGGIATDLFGLPENLKNLAVKIRVLDTPQAFVRKALNRLMRGKAQYINGLLNRISIVAVGSTPRWLRMQVKKRLLDRDIRRP